MPVKNGVGRTDTKMQLDLKWHGPYSVVEEPGSTYLFDSTVEAAGCPGVYLHTVHYKGEELVFYIGKTDVSFLDRLWKEFRSRRRTAWNWITDLSSRKQHVGRPDCWDWIPDPKELKRGIKKWIYEPYGYKKPNLKTWMGGDAAFFKKCWDGYLQTIRIFVAPISGSRKEVIDTETALAWAVWDYEEKQKDHFLTNGRWPSRLSYQFELRNITSARFRGLPKVISG